MITIHGDAVSGNCLKVKWAAERLAIPFAWTHVDVVAGQTRTPEFLALNPAGQVPRSWSWTTAACSPSPTPSSCTWPRARR
jgi:hypothetical protein